MIFIRGARQLVTLRGPALPRRGMQLCELGVIPDGALLIDGEEIREVGTTRRVENLTATRSATVIDATGKVVLPGFVDCHTRLILASLLSPSLDAESARGPSAERPPLPSLLRSGSSRLLRGRARAWTRWFAAQGTTTLEVRTGLGLDLHSEVTGLRAARLLDGHPLEVDNAFLACGPIPGKAAAADSDVEQVTEILLPMIRRRRLAAVCDVQCGPGSFDVRQTRDILERAKGLRFALRVQGDGWLDGAAVRLAVEAGALSVEGLWNLGEQEIGLLAASPTIATLLPGVGFAEDRGGPAPARQLIDRGAAVALATGFGPASPTLSMPMVISLACRRMNLSPEEAITAATLNAAAAMGRASRLGSLEPGKQADLAIFDVRDYREIPYYFGFGLCLMTIKKGRIAYQAPELETPTT